MPSQQCQSTALRISESEIEVILVNVLLANFEEPIIG